MEYFKGYLKENGGEGKLKADVILNIISRDFESNRRIIDDSSRE